MIYQYNSLRLYTNRQPIRARAFSGHLAPNIMPRVTRVIYHATRRAGYGRSSYLLRMHCISHITMYSVTKPRIMSAIMNISSICRCCLAEGEFKSLQLSYTYKKNIEVYANMLLGTFDITISLPSVDASCSICDECIRELRAATRFRKQVEDSEVKFLKYFEEELETKQKNQCAPISNSEIKIESIDEEFDAKKQVFLKEDLSDPEDTGFDDGLAEPEPDIQEPELDTTTDTIKKESGKNNKKNKKVTKKGKHRGNVLFMPAVPEPMPVPEYTCRECGRECKSYYSLYIHLRTHKAEYLCELCRDEFKGIRNFYKHLLTHDQFRDDPYLKMAAEDKFECDYCHAKYQTKRRLQLHIYSHLGLEKEFVCEICGFKCNAKSNLKMHIENVHEKFRKYPCDLCDKKYAKKIALQDHKLRNHEGVLPKACRFCEKRFVNVRVRRRHEDRVHSNKQPRNMKINQENAKNYFCDLCNKTLQSYLGYTRHMFRHNPSFKTNIKPEPYPCEICHKKYYSKYSYERHKTTQHSALAKTQWKMSESDDLDKLKMESDHLCNQCGMKYTSLKRLNNHILTMHLNPKEKVKCERCKIMVRASYFDKHMRTHIVRPHKCKYCKNSYPKKSALLRHEEKHLNSTVELFSCKCDLCHKVFKSKKGYKRHLQTTHRAVYQQDKPVVTFSAPSVSDSPSSGVSGPFYKLESA